MYMRNKLLVPGLGVPRSVQNYVCILIVILQKEKPAFVLRGTLVRDGPASALLRHLDL